MIDISIKAHYLYFYTYLDTKLFRFELICFVFKSTLFVYVVFEDQFGLGFWDF